MKKVLICEDDPILNKAIEFKFKKANYDTVTAMNGEEAFSYLENNNYDLIITDLKMPGHNGLELIHFVRKTLKKKIPIIVLTSINYENTLLKAFDFGADDYVTKPFGPNELIARARYLCDSNTEAEQKNVS